MKYQMKVQTALATQQHLFSSSKTLTTFLQANPTPAYAARVSLSEEQQTHTDNTSAGAEEY